MKLMAAILVLLATSPANSQFLNQINSPSEEGIYAFKAVLTETKLLYITEKNEADNLWSMDLTSKIKEPLFSLSENRIDWPLINLNNQIYFRMGLENRTPFLWRTDGTPENTRQVSETKLTGDIKVRNGRLFSMNSQRKLVQLRNDELINYDINVPGFFAVCAFDENHFVVQTQNQSGDDYSLTRYDNGKITEVYNYSTTVLYQTSSNKFDDSCYFTIANSFFNQDELPPTIISIPEQGEANEFSTASDLPTVAGLFSHQDRLYAIAGNDNNYDSIYRLTTDLTGYDATVTLDGVTEFSFAYSTNHLITSYVKPNDADFATAFVFLDADLNTVPSYPSSAFSAASFFGHSEATVSDVIVGFNEGSVDTIIQSISPSNEVSVISIKNHRFRGVISNPNLSQFYLLLNNRNLGYSNIYSLNEKPVLNDLINGTWHDPDIINQGLVVQKGRRSNGSEYVFTTLYTFDQGEPLWLAGVSDLKAEQLQLEITLYQYDGPQLFQYGVTPNREVFGQLTLELETCDQLKITINSDDYNQSLSLLRIDDTSYKHLCVDITALTLDGNNKAELSLENDDE